MPSIQFKSLIAITWMKLLSAVTLRDFFLCKSGKYWVAVDNSTGDAWTENFSTKHQAILWLLQAEDRLKAMLLSLLHSYQLKRAIEIWAIMSFPFILSTTLFLRF